MSDGAGGRLAVGVLAEQPVTAWVERAAALLARSSAVAEVRILPVRREPLRGAAARAVAGYAALDRRLFTVAPDALAPATGRPASSAMPVEEAGACAARAGLDVVVNVTGRTLGRAELSLPPATELWELCHEGVPAGSPQALFRAFAAGSPAALSTLARVDADGGRELLYASRSAVRRLSLQRTRNAVYWKGATFLARAVQLRALGARQPSPPAGTWAAAEDGAPTRLRDLGLLLVRLAGAVLGYLRERLLHRWSWAIVWQERDEPATSAAEFRPQGVLTPPPGRCFADPFLVADGGRHYLFYEDWRDELGRAVIAVAEIEHDTVGPGRQVVAADHHLSYPFVFAVDGVRYMVPEAAESGVVRLYRARSFPYEWEVEALLLEGIRAYDATLLRHEGLWYLFAAVPAEDGDADELHVFSAPELRGPYRPHRLNPVVSDVCRARPAGRILAEGGRLLRPGQDCSRGYGSALVLSELRRLTPTEYDERPVGRIDPTWVPWARGTHTIDHDGTFQVMDLKQLAPRRPGRRSRAARLVPPSPA